MLSITGFVPLISEQLNAVLSMLIVPIPQLSVLPLLTCATLSVACPALFKKIVGFLHLAIGADTSFMVTLAVQVAMFPPTSVALSVTVFMPMLAQLKRLGVSVNVMEQLSVEPLLTADVVTVTVPFTPKLAMTSLHFATGRVTSLTVTVAVQVEVFPLPSLTVRVTRFAPTLLQVKLLATTDCRLTVPQLSEPDW